MTATAGRVVLVVGATSGIGLATARQLVGEGARVALMARSEESLRQVSAQLGGDPLVLPADVTDAAAVTRAVERVLAVHGRIDGVVTTAQVMAYGTVEQVPTEVFQRIVDTAIMGTVNLATAVLPVFRAQGGGTMVVVNSLLGQIPVPSMSAYCTAKFGQLGLVRSLQLEVSRDRGVHVCLVSPGAIDTPIYAQAATYASHLGSAPPPVVSPEAVARACVRSLERPRRMRQVGPVNRLSILGYQLVPAVYDRAAPVLVKYVVLRGPTVPDSVGNVEAPVPAAEGLRGGWTLFGRLRLPGRRPRWRRRV